MPFNIDQFVGNVSRSGTLQTNRFEVRMRPPGVVAGRGRQYYGTADEMSRLLTFRAQEVKVPGVNMDTYDHRRYGVGPRQKTVTNVNFSDVGITFLETSENEVFKFFYDWTNYIFDYSGIGGARLGQVNYPASFTAQYREDYSTDIEIHVYNAAGTTKTENMPTVEDSEVKPVTIIHMFEAYPTSIGDSSLSWDNNNSLYKVNVSFTFTSWRIDNYDKKFNWLRP